MTGPEDVAAHLERGGGLVLVKAEALSSLARAAEERTTRRAAVGAGLSGPGRLSGVVH